MNCGRQLLDLSQLNLDGTHSLAKNGREAVFGRGFMKSYVREFQNRSEGIKNPIDSQSVKTTEKGGPKAMMQAKK